MEKNTLKSDDSTHFPLKKCLAAFLLILIFALGLFIIFKLFRPSQTKITIFRYYEQPDSINNVDAIVMEGVSEGEFLEVKVQGAIFDVKLVSLNWDNERSLLVEKDTIHSLKKLENGILVIKTYLPDGIPMEKLKWKSKTGEGYEFIIQEHGIENKWELVYE